MAKSLLYFQSGGPTAVINSSLYGVILEAKKHGEIDQVLGARYGVTGLIDDEVVDLGKEDPEQVELLLQTPGMILGSSRIKLEENQEVFAMIGKTLKKHNVGYLLVNGGNDSMDTCEKLARHFPNVRVIGIPKTIDNDLVMNDHSIGFPSAAKYILNVMKEISLDTASYRSGKVTLVEIMGRDAGYLTAISAALPLEYAPDLVYVPEMGFDQERFLSQIKEAYERKGHIVVAISEGLDIPHEVLSVQDSFGHHSREGIVFTLSFLIKKTLNLSVRAMSLSLPTRASAECISKVDQDEAIEAASNAVKAALAGETGKLVCVNRDPSSKPYQAVYTLEDVSDVSNKNRPLPSRYVEGFGTISPKIRDYILPLVEGEVNLRYANGVLESASFRYVKA